MVSVFSADTAPTASNAQAISMINKTTCFLIISPPKFEKKDILHTASISNYFYLVIHI